MATVGATSLVFMRTDRNDGAITVTRDCNTRFISGSLAWDVPTALRPLRGSKSLGESTRGRQRE